jgi:hypothetical protein
MLFFSPKQNFFLLEVNFVNILYAAYAPVDWFTCELHPMITPFSLRGLKLELIEGPHSKEKMFSGPHFNWNIIWGPQITRKPLKKAKFVQNF